MGSFFTKYQKQKGSSIITVEPLMHMHECVFNKEMITTSERVPQKNLCNELNRHRWRGLSQFKFRYYDSGGFLCASTGEISHCVYDISVCGLEYKDLHRIVTIKIPENLHKKLEDDIKSLSQLTTTLYCKDRQDFDDACTSIIQHVPEFKYLKGIVHKVVYNIDHTHSFEA